MNRNFLSIALIVAIIALAASIGWLMIGQRELESQLTLKETEIAYGEATLVQLFSQQRETKAEDEVALATIEAELLSLRGEATAVAPVIMTHEAGASQDSASAETESESQTADAEAPPQVRIRLEQRDPIQFVGQPLKIIASASHPVGIASLNILVNDELLLQGDPFDPRMEIMLTEWTPLEIGTYQIKAISTSIRGRASEPVILEIEVIETDDPELLLNTQLRLIERNVQELRGLKQNGDLNINLIDRNNLQENIGSDLLSEFTPEDAARDVLILSAFDFMARDYQLYEALTQLYGAVIAGYYDEETDSLYVISDDNVLDEEEQLTHAHEYMHALQDQYFTLADIQNGSLDSDATLALRALAEGEASLVEFIYRTSGYLSGEQAADSDPVFSVPEFIPAPNIFVSQLAFPYVRGQEFLNVLYASDGFAGVNDAWANRPTSTEQILHLDRYLAGDQPIPVSLPTDAIMQTLGDDWEQITDDVFGEFRLIEYLGLVLEEDEVNEAALGWGGDRYGVFYNRQADERIMVLSIVWDQPADLEEFVGAYKNWADLYLGAELSSSTAGVTCWQNGSEEQCLLVTPDSTIITRAETAEQRQKINQLMLP